jgi:outer membrane receptor protein involved in Fe transport
MPEGEKFMSKARVSRVSATRLAVASLPALLVPLPVFAQIEEITVTARKVEERLTDVPIAVEAFSADIIQRRGLRNIADVTRQSASLVFDQGAVKSDTRISIRGLSPSRGRQNAALLVDGIDVSSEAISSSGGSILLNQRLLDIERIEVLKGPQIALYGRSAFNGAIQFVTRQPSEEFEAELNTDLNVENQYSLSGSLSGPVLGDYLGVRLNASWWDEEGFYRNTVSGDTVGGDKGYGFSVATRSEFGDRFTLRGRAEFTHSESQPSAEAFVPFNTSLDLPAEALTVRPGDQRGVLVCLPDDLRNRPGPPSLAALGDFLEAGPGLEDRYRLISADPNNPVTGGGPYCQKQIPFFTGKIPDGKDLAVALGTNPFNAGKDFKGVESDTIRLSLLGSYELDLGTFSSWTGYTYDKSTESLDQGKFGVPDPNSIYRDSNVNTFLFDNDKKTTQFSQELRYRTEFDGPLNITLGGLTWQENVKNKSNSNPLQSAGSYCFFLGNVGLPVGVLAPAPGCPGWTEIPVQQFVTGVRPNDERIRFADTNDPYLGIGEYRQPTPADRKTDHRSIYGMLEFDVTSSVSFMAEGRLSYETVDADGPRFLFPGANGGPGGAAFCGFPGLPCTEEFLFGPNGPFASWNSFTTYYDLWNPVTNRVNNAVLRGVYEGQTLVDLIPDACRNDPGVQQRIARAEQGINDFDFFNPYCVERISRTDKWFSPKLTMSWKPTDDALLYASWARAEKPGGFSLLTFGASGLNRDLAEFEPEVMEVYEIGGNTALFNNTVRLSGSVFFQDYTDKQVLAQALSPDGRPISRIENASSAEVWGAEVEVLWQPIREFLGGDWSMSVGYTWLDTEYVNYGDNTTSENNIALAGNCGVANVVNENTGEVRPACAVSYSGNRLEKAPRNAVVNNITYTRSLVGDMDMFIALDNQWTDKRFLEFSNESYLAAYWNSDLQIGLRTGRWEALAYVSNLFDDDTVRSASSSPGLSCCFQLGVAVDFAQPDPTLQGLGSGAEVPIPKAAFLPPPRVIGARLKYRFGAAVR